MSKRLVLNIILAMAVSINETLEGIESRYSIGVLVVVNIVIQICMLIKKQEKKDATEIND